MTERKNIKMTKARRVIIDELRKLTSHPTADELYKRVRKKIPNISLGTIYRNLMKLADAGMIIKLESGSGKFRFDGNPANHYHVRCSVCGCVDDIMNMPVMNLNKKVEALTNYEIQDHRLEFIGICPKCRKNAENLKLLKNGEK